MSTLNDEESEQNYAEWQVDKIQEHISSYPQGENFHNANILLKALIQVRKVENELKHMRSRYKVVIQFQRYVDTFKDSYDNINDTLIHYIFQSKEGIDIDELGEIRQQITNFKQDIQQISNHLDEYDKLSLKINTDPNTLSYTDIIIMFDTAITWLDKLIDTLVTQTLKNFRLKLKVFDCFLSELETLECNDSKYIFAAESREDCIRTAKQLQHDIYILETQLSDNTKKCHDNNTSSKTPTPPKRSLQLQTVKNDYAVGTSTERKEQNDDDSSLQSNLSSSLWFYKKLPATSSKAKSNKPIMTFQNCGETVSFEKLAATMTKKIKTESMESDSHHERLAKKLKHIDNDECNITHKVIDLIDTDEDEESDTDKNSEFEITT
jgi:hypothetical protein